LELGARREERGARSEERGERREERGERCVYSLPSEDECRRTLRRRHV
jgi:hypothetical protein